MAVIAVLMHLLLYIAVVAAGFTFSLLFVFVKVEELRILQEKTPKNLWTEDLEKFMVELDVSLSRYVYTIA